MSRIIVLTSGKGGVGKTTITANLGVALAQLGRSVAVVDADFGLRNMDLFLGLENRVVYTSVDVIGGECRLEQALVKDKRTPNLVLLPASQTRNKTAVTAGQMSKLTDSLAATHDFVLIDCPAGIEQGFRNAVAAASEALVITTPELSAARDADRVIGLLESSQIKSIQFVVNRIRLDMVAQMIPLDDLVETLAIPLLGIVPEDRAVILSNHRGEPLSLLSRPPLAALAIKNIARRILGETVPMLNLQKGFMGKLKHFLTQKVI